LDRAKVLGWKFFGIARVIWRQPERVLTNRSLEFEYWRQSIMVIDPRTALGTPGRGASPARIAET